MSFVRIAHRVFPAVFLFTVVYAEGPQIRPASQLSNPYIEWMKKVADWQLTQSTWNSSVSWERGALFAGMMACYEVTKDEKYLDKSRQWAQQYNWRMASDSRHADNHACAQTYLELYLLDEPDPVRYAHFKYVADIMVNDPRHFYCNVASGSNVWWWCDALFMAPPAFVRLGRILNNSSYADLMHMMWGETQSCLYDVEEHLFFRDITYFDDRYNDKKVYWSRGNGWVLAGTARVLQYLPPDDPFRSRYITLLQEMAAKLITLQQPDGFWHSDLLSPERYNNPESSGTGFFTYGIAWGINNGFLDEQTYWPAAQAGWEALKSAVQPSGLLGWVQPVGAGPAATSPTTTDVFGVGAYLLAGSEIQKYVLQKDPTTIDLFETYQTDAQLKAVWNDGTVNGTASEIVLGNFGDKFLQMTYRNDRTPYRSEIQMVFAAPKDFTLNGSAYLSILVRGKADNTPDLVYVRLEDGQGRTAVQTLSDPNAVRTAIWMELGFPLSGFEGIDRTQIVKLTVGIGNPSASSAGGQGTVRIDNIRLMPLQCIGAAEDFTGNCEVDLEDLALLAADWMEDYAVTITPTNPGTANLLAYWPMEGTFQDMTENGFNAVAGGTPVFDAGKSGQAVYLNGTSYLACQNSGSISLQQGGSITAWVKSGGLSFPWASVVSKGISSWRLIRNNVSSAMSFHFNIAGGGEYQANGTTPILDNQWHHLAAVYDGSRIALYVDGVLDASCPTPNPVNVTSDLVWIGGRVDRPFDRNWTGWIDEVRIYTIPLTEEHIRFLAGLGPLRIIPAPRPSDLVFDGMIDMNDLAAFVLGWLRNSYWP
ncbi:MAG TPA: glycoside hydrolase family 88 protein [Anaerohalosphaeraceae bacterium]|mgnify:FL=1|nr:glycoside hydrolase family 88 protein [Anaerohalosphaeraceae bacterium]